MKLKTILQQSFNKMQKKVTLNERIWENAVIQYVVIFSDTLKKNCITFKLQLTTNMTVTILRTPVTKSIKDMATISIKLQ